MSTEKRVTFNEHDEPVVTITITGWSDAFRFAWAMGHLQCDFADVARRIGGSLRRRIGTAAFREMNAHFTSGSLAWVRDDPPEDDGIEGAMKALVGPSPSAATTASDGTEGGAS